MSENWYKKCMPRVSEVRPILTDLSKSLSKISGIKGLRVFGSLAQHYNEPDYRIKDIDIIALTKFNSADLLAINQDLLSYRPEFLEEEGYDVKAVAFSRQFTKTACEYPLDFWTFSSDKKLLHWGPFVSDRQESEEIKQEAETFASKQTGFNLSKIAAKSSDNHRSDWYSSFNSYVQNQFKDMPTGWYCSEEQNCKDIIAVALPLDK